MNELEQKILTINAKIENSNKLVEMILNRSKILNGEFELLDKVMKYGIRRSAFQ